MLITSVTFRLFCNSESPIAIQFSSWIQIVGFFFFFFFSKYVDRKADSLSFFFFRVGRILPIFVVGWMNFLLLVACWFAVISLRKKKQKQIIPVRCCVVWCDFIGGFSWVCFIVAIPSNESPNAQSSFVHYVLLVSQWRVFPPRFDASPHLLNFFFFFFLLLN